MKILASGSDSARILVRSSFDDKHDRNSSANSSDLESSDGSKCNPGDTLLEKSGLYRYQTMTSSENGRDPTSL